MYGTGHNTYYFIDEPAVLLNKSMVVPMRWLEDEEGRVWADVWEIEHNEVMVSVLI